jgi:hypothetical protein
VLDRVEYEILPVPVVVCDFDNCPHALGAERQSNMAETHDEPDDNSEGIYKSSKSHIELSLAPSPFVA